MIDDEALDRRIRGAIREIVDESPPAPEVDAFGSETPVAPASPRRGARRRRGAVLAGVGAAAAVLAAVATVALRDDDVPVRAVDDAGSAPEPVACGDELPVSPTWLPQGFDRDRREGPAPQAGDGVGDGQLAAHWTDGVNAVEVRWPAAPVPAGATDQGPVVVAGRPGRLYSLAADQPPTLVQVEWTEHPERCGLLGVRGYGEDPDRQSDYARAFAEGLVEPGDPSATPSTEPAEPACATAGTPEDPSSVVVYLYCGLPGVGLLHPVPRPDRPATPAGAVEALLAGVTDAEAAAGWATTVPAVATGAPATVTVDGAGVAHVDIAADFASMNNWGTSGVVLPFVDQLFAALFQFPQVTAVDLGSFCETTELTCDPISRTAWEAMERVAER